MNLFEKVKSIIRKIFANKRSKELKIVIFGIGIWIMGFENKVFASPIINTIKVREDINPPRNVLKEVILKPAIILIAVIVGLLIYFKKSKSSKKKKLLVITIIVMIILAGITISIALSRIHATKIILK